MSTEGLIPQEAEEITQNRLIHLPICENVIRLKYSKESNFK